MRKSIPRKRVIKQTKNHWFRSQWFFVLIAVLFVIVSISFGREFIRSRSINSEIIALQNEVEELERAKKEKADFVEYLKTETYFEEQARLKLGLKESGEKVIVLQEQGTIEEKPLVVYQQQQGERLSNPSKWYQYFWGGNLN